MSQENQHFLRNAISARAILSASRTTVSAHLPTASTRKEVSTNASTGL